MRKIITIAILLLIMNSVRGAASYTYNTPVCGLTDSFTNTSTGTNVGYVWYFDDAASGANNLVVNSTKITQSHTFTTYGTYVVKLYIVDINNQAVDSVAHTVVVIQLPNLFIIPTSFPTYCLGDSINNFLTATNNPAYKYVWSPLPRSYSSPNSVEYTFTHTQTYTVTVTDTTTGCTNSKSVTVKFNNCNGTNQLRISNYELRLYPNPAGEWLMVNGEWLEGKNEVFVIQNTLGQMLLEGLLNDEITSININSLSAGIYFIRVGDEVKKFVKE